MLITRTDLESNENLHLWSTSGSNADRQLSLVLNTYTGEDIVSIDDYVKGPWGTQPPEKIGRYRSSFTIPGNFLGESTVIIHLRILNL